jgi:hypothetical protein
MIVAPETTMPGGMGGGGGGDDGLWRKRASQESERRKWVMEVVRERGSRDPGIVIGLCE